MSHHAEKYTPEGTLATASEKEMVYVNCNNELKEFRK
jgi:hypothetical protein